MKINDEKNTNLKSMFMTRIRLICSVTDVDGKYEITIPRECVTSLVFSYIGMKVREVVIEHKIVINVKLEEDTKNGRGHCDGYIQKTAGKLYRICHHYQQQGVENV